MKRTALVLSLLLTALTALQAQSIAAAQAASEQPASRWIALGTRGGPMASGTRSQPANESISFRFDLPVRSIVFTGDTGPSPALEELAQGADLLVAEMMDIDHTIANVRRNSPDLDPEILAATERHLRDHHLLAKDVGMLAQQAGVGGVVVTHFVGREPGEPGHSEYLRQIGEHFAGPVTIAADLGAF